MHTVLSLLGIIIGVGALISILALGDGMERFGRDQLANTTDLNTIDVHANKTVIMDGIRLDRTDAPLLTQVDYDSIQFMTIHKAEVHWISVKNTWVHTDLDTNHQAVYLTAVLTHSLGRQDSLITGRYFSDSDTVLSEGSAVINDVLANKITRHPGLDTSILNKMIYQEKTVYKIAGVIHNKLTKKDLPTMIIPVKRLNAEQLKNYETRFLVNVTKIEDLPAVQSEIKRYLSKYPRKPEDFSALSNEYRVDQLKRGVLLFKSIMGLIVGISILVGGIGIMNVLLMSVTERTREIGIRKAIGAKPREIAMQFMAEAMTISLLGSVLGILFGMLTLTIALPILKRVLHGDIIQVSYQSGSILIILLIAILIGLIFGVYPAYKASRQSPIDAIRNE